MALQLPKCLDIKEFAVFGELHLITGLSTEDGTGSRHLAYRLGDAGTADPPVLRLLDKSSEAIEEKPIMAYTAYDGLSNISVVIINI